MPITWKNVNAPGFVAPAGLARSGGAAVVGAFDQFANAANAADQNRITAYDNATENNSADAISQIQALTNPDTYQEDKQRIIEGLAGTNIDQGQINQAGQEQDTFLNNKLNNALSRENTQLGIDQKEFAIANQDADRANKLKADELAYNISNSEYKNMGPEQQRAADESAARVSLLTAQKNGLLKSQEEEDAYNKHSLDYLSTVRELRDPVTNAVDLDKLEKKLDGRIPLNVLQALHNSNKDFLNIEGQAATAEKARLELKKDSEINTKEFADFIENVPDTSFPLTGRSHEKQKADVSTWLNSNAGQSIPRNVLYKTLSDAKFDIGQANVLLNEYRIKQGVANTANNPVEEATKQLDVTNTGALVTPPKEDGGLIKSAIDVLTSNITPPAPAGVNAPAVAPTVQKDAGTNSSEAYFNNLKKEQSTDRRGRHIGNAASADPVEVVSSTLNSAVSSGRTSINSSLDAKRILNTPTATDTEKTNALQVMKDSLISASSKDKLRIKRDIARFEKQLNKAR